MTVVVHLTKVGLNLVDEMLRRGSTMPKYLNCTSVYTCIYICIYMYLYVQDMFLINDAGSMSVTRLHYNTYIDMSWGLSPRAGHEAWVEA